MKPRISYLYPLKNFNLQTLEEGKKPLLFHPASAKEPQYRLLLVKTLNFPYVPYESELSIGDPWRPPMCQLDCRKCTEVFPQTLISRVLHETATCHS